MRVEMTRIYADPERSLQPGDVAAFPPDKAQALIASGAARAVDEPLRTRPVAAAKTRGRGKQKAKPAEEQPVDGQAPDAAGDEGDGGAAS